MSVNSNILIGLQKSYYTKAPKPLECPREQEGRKGSGRKEEEGKGRGKSIQKVRSRG